MTSSQPVTNDDSSLAKKTQPWATSRGVPILPIGEVETSYYLRLRVVDRPGVLADITRILADLAISIDAMVQREPGEGEEQVDIIMLTQRTFEKNVNAAIVKIVNTPEIRDAYMKQGLDPATSTPDEFSTFIRTEVAQNMRLVKSAGIRVE